MAAALSSSPDWAGALSRARAHSPFLSRALERLPAIEALLEEGQIEEALLAAKAAGEDIEDTGVALRRERLALALALAVGDLAEGLELDRVMRELSTFADRALHAAIAASIARRVPGAAPDGMIGLALGKHGAGELNYSSDIDPILIYDPDTLPRRERHEPGEAAQRYARETVRILSETTPEGYVFRVDLRLRPASEVSPLAIPLGAATTHYESSALAWERAAFIRARAAAGDIAAGERFLDAIRPFVWRRSLDFGAIDEIRRLTARIRDSHSGPTEAGPGFNLKLGRGGIREIEFFAQTHQLVHGGRDASLRGRGTRAALDALAATGHIPPGTARILGEAYDRLRTIEHRLQMVADRQTHSLPDGEALENVAHLHGLESGAALVDLVAKTCAPVAELFGELIAEDGGAPASPAAANRLEELGFTDAESVSQRIARWSDGRYRALRSTAAVSAFDAILPDLIEAIADSEAPDHALARFETLLEKLPSAINLFRLLEARPGLFQLLVDCLTLAPPLADELARRPELLDALIDRSAFDLPGDVAALMDRMARGERGDDYERKLDRIRVVTGEQRFALGMQLIEAQQDPLDVASALSRVAEAALNVALDAAQEEFAGAHGRFADGELVVLGLGRLGGGALTHASDLDIVYLFTDGAIGAESDGGRPLGRTLYFNRLAQRVSAALSVPTAEGALYEVDTRLRPQGAQGPLAVGIDGFARYQREDAWTWEHMALMRSRVVAGSDAARGRIEAIVREIATMPRDPEKLREDVLAMRTEMASHKAAKGPLDAKLLRGGLVDLEFLVHFLQLRDRTALTPDLSFALKDLAEAGLVDEDLREAHRFLTRLLVGARLLAPDQHPPGGEARQVLARLVRCDDFPAVLAALGRARACVADHWARLFNIELEIT